MTRFQICFLPLIVVAVTLFHGCATSGQPQTLTIEPDPNALAIIEQTKAEPSAIRGGGMIYELYVGSRYSAIFDEKEGVLHLTDLANNKTCDFAANGLLNVPEQNASAFYQYCRHLAKNAIVEINEL